MLKDNGFEPPLLRLYNGYCDSFDIIRALAWLLQDYKGAAACLAAEH